MSCGLEQEHILNDVPDGSDNKDDFDNHDDAHDKIINSLDLSTVRAEIQPLEFADLVNSVGKH